VKITRFDPTDDLIIVEGSVWGPCEGRVRPLRLVLDTGAAETIIIPEVLDELGYSARHGDAITVIRSAVGREEGYLIRVARFACLGHHAAEYRVHAHDLPEGWGIEGLIGLSSSSITKPLTTYSLRRSAAHWRKGTAAGLRTRKPRAMTMSRL
jgi:predicted aspartyl protease